MKRTVDNPISKLRISLVDRYLESSIERSASNLSHHWQPMLLILVKLLVVAYLSYRFHALYPFLSTWLKKGFEFFKLHEIYNFRFPKKRTFDTVAEVLCLVVIAYYGIPFFIRQVQAFFSSLVIDPSEKKVYYIKSFLLVKDIYIFMVPEIHHIVLKQNIISRLLNMGTVVLEKKAGEKVIVRSLFRAPDIVKQLMKIKKVVK